jgi:KDO2-lipid IV(A) lauroyltransferase
MYAELGRGLMELVLSFGSRRAIDLVDFPADFAAELAEARRMRGAIVCASHTGNWELAAGRLAEEAPTTALVKRQHVRWVDALCTRLRRRLGVGLVFANEPGALDTLAERIRACDAVVLVGDQVPSLRAHGIAVPFLGAPAWVDRAAFALAARTGATVFVTVQRRVGARIRIDRLVTLTPPARDRARWIQEAAQAATEHLDAFVRQHPEAWLWLHRRWRVPALRVGVDRGVRSA